LQAWLAAGSHASLARLQQEAHKLRRSHGSNVMAAKMAFEIVKNPVDR